MATTYPPQVPIYGMYGFLVWKTFLSKTGNYQLLTTDNGSFCTNAGAAGPVTFTLPAIAANYRFGFYVVAGQNLLVTSKEGGNIVAFNNAAANTLAFQTAGQLIGGCLILQSNELGTLWYSHDESAGSNALTIS